jgi:hypothetical protein
LTQTKGQKLPKRLERMSSADRDCLEQQNNQNAMFGVCEENFFQLGEKMQNSPPEGDQASAVATVGCVSAQVPSNLGQKGLIFPTPFPDFQPPPPEKAERWPDFSSWTWKHE